MQMLPAIGARLRRVAHVIGRKPPASDSTRREYERQFRELQRREAEMSRIYQLKTHIESVRTYHRELICSAIRNTERSWTCGHCHKGDLGESPRVGEFCPKCSARVEEVIRGQGAALTCASALH